jgi:hypothetical protein
MPLGIHTCRALELTSALLSLAKRRVSPARVIVHFGPYRHGVLGADPHLSDELEQSLLRQFAPDSGSAKAEAVY